MRKKITLLVFLLILQIQIHPNFPTQPVNASFVYTNTLPISGGGYSFGTPYGMSVNSTTLAVADPSNSKVLFLDFQGNLKGTIDGAQVGPGNFTISKTVFITDSLIGIGCISYVKFFDSAGNFQFMIGNETSGTGNDQFGDIRDVITNGTNIFVSDQNNSRVQVFDMSGNYADTFTTAGMDPFGLAYNGTNLFVADNANSVIRIFNPDGTLAPDFVGFGSGTGAGTSSAPFDVAVDPIHNFVYLLQTFSVSIFKPHSNSIAYDFVGYVGDTVYSQNTFLNALNVVSNGTHVFVSDLLLQNIQIFEIREGETQTTTETQTQLQTETQTQSVTQTEIQTITQTNTQTIVDNNTITTTEVSNQIVNHTIISNNTVIQSTTIVSTQSSSPISLISIFIAIIGFSFSSKKFKNHKK